MLENSISKRLPCLVKEWDFEKNGELIPDEILWQSGKKIWWLCERKHSFCVPPSTRIRFKKQTKEIYVSPCPYCAGKAVLSGFNDLETLNHELAKEWHPVKNKGTSPDEVTAASHKKVWWLCKQNHEWQAYVYSRVNGNRCPYCSGFKPIIGETDLATLAPEIAEEWNYEKNKGKTPDMFTKYSNKKVWWKCRLGHEWRININNRTSLGTGCSRCAKSRNSH